MRPSSLIILSSVLLGVSCSSKSRASRASRATSIDAKKSLLSQSTRINDNHQVASAARHLGYDENYYYNNQAYAYDLSTYSVRYEKCQYVRTYDDELAAEEESDSPLAMKHFVLFRLCPTDTCETHCGEDEENNVNTANNNNRNSEDAYGKYVTDVETYLEYTVEQQRQIFENMCDNCAEADECGQQQDDGGDDENNNNNAAACQTECGQLCNLYGNMEENGLVDASELLECQKFDIPDNDRGRQLRETMRQQKRQRRRRQAEEDDDQENNGEDDDEEQELFVGPRCKGTGIVISLFSDENCWDPLAGLDLEGLLGAELSYYFLEHTYQSYSNDISSTCLTCAENDENANQNDNQDADKVNEMCEGLYNAAAKCETPTGISVGFIQTKRDNFDYENQVETEFFTCGFIDSLLWNSYTEEGEIDYKSRQDVYIRKVTKLQAITLVMIGLFFGVLFALMHYFQKRIADVKSKGGLQVDSRAVWT